MTVHEGTQKVRILTPFLINFFIFVFIFLLAAEWTTIESR